MQNIKTGTADITDKSPKEDSQGEDSFSAAASVSTKAADACQQQISNEISAGRTQKYADATGKTGKNG